MPVPEYLSQVALRAHPLEEVASLLVIGGATLSTRVLLDAGITFGPSSGYAPGTPVALTRIQVTTQTTTFTITATTASGPLFFVFVVVSNSTFGMTSYTAARLGSQSNPVNPDLGQGFLQIGDMSLLPSPGVYNGSLNLDERCIQSSVNQVVSRVFLANETTSITDNPCNGQTFVKNYSRHYSVPLLGYVGDINFAGGVMSTVRSDAGLGALIVEMTQDRNEGENLVCTVEPRLFYPQPTPQNWVQGVQPSWIPRCGDLVYSINGVTPNETTNSFTIETGYGVTVTPDLLIPSQLNISVLDDVVFLPNIPPDSCSSSSSSSSSSSVSGSGSSGSPPSSSSSFSQSSLSSSSSSSNSASSINPGICSTYLTEFNGTAGPLPSPWNTTALSGSANWSQSGGVAIPAIATGKSLAWLSTPENSAGGWVGFSVEGIPAVNNNRLEVQILGATGLVTSGPVISIIPSVNPAVPINNISTTVLFNGNRLCDSTIYNVGGQSTIRVLFDKSTKVMRVDYKVSNSNRWSNAIRLNMTTATVGANSAGTAMGMAPAFFGLNALAPVVTAAGLSARSPNSNDNPAGTANRSELNVQGQVDDNTYWRYVASDYQTGGRWARVLGEDGGTTFDNNFITGTPCNYNYGFDYILATTAQMNDIVDLNDPRVMDLNSNFEPVTTTSINLAAHGPFPTWRTISELRFRDGRDHYVSFFLPRPSGTSSVPLYLRFISSNSGSVIPASGTATSITYDGFQFLQGISLLDSLCGCWHSFVIRGSIQVQAACQTAASAVAPFTSVAGIGAVVYDRPPRKIYNAATAPTSLPTFAGVGHIFWKATSALGAVGSQVTSWAASGSSGSWFTAQSGAPAGAELILTRFDNPPTFAGAPTATIIEAQNGRRAVSIAGCHFRAPIDTSFARRRRTVFVVCRIEGGFSATTVYRLVGRGADDVTTELHGYLYASGINSSSGLELSQNVSCGSGNVTPQKTLFNAHGYAVYTVTNNAIWSIGADTCSLMVNESEPSAKSGNPRGSFRPAPESSVATAPYGLTVGPIRDATQSVNIESASILIESICIYDGVLNFEQQDTVRDYLYRQLALNPHIDKY